jgi:hypothetical protein
MDACSRWNNKHKQVSRRRKSLRIHRLRETKTLDEIDTLCLQLPNRAVRNRSTRRNRPRRKNCTIQRVRSGDNFLRMWEMLGLVFV